MPVAIESSSSLVVISSDVLPGEFWKFFVIQKYKLAHSENHPPPYASFLTSQVMGFASVQGVLLRNLLKSWDNGKPSYYRDVW